MPDGPARTPAITGGVFVSYKASARRNEYPHGGNPKHNNRCNVSDEAKDDDSPTRRTMWLSLVILGVVVGVVGLWYWLGIKNFKSFEKPEEASHFGESFGYVNTLFSALALAGVILALYLQMAELRLQRKELRLTKDELAKSAKAQTELVHLSALSSLLDAYLRQYDNDRNAENDLEEALRLNKNVEACIAYKVRVCRSELERIQQLASGKLIGEAADTSIATLRRQLWVEEFGKLLWGFEEYLKQLIGDVRTHTAGSEVVGNHISNRIMFIGHLLKWDTAIDDSSESQTGVRNLHGDMSAFHQTFHDKGTKAFTQEQYDETEKFLTRAQELLKALKAKK
jgi:hypothetical protein